MKKSALAAGLKSRRRTKAADVTQRTAQNEQHTTGDRTHWRALPTGSPPRPLCLFRPAGNTGKNLKQLLGEAINDLCAKYRKPQPYAGEP